MVAVATKQREEQGPLLVPKFKCSSSSSAAPWNPFCSVKGRDELWRGDPIQIMLVAKSICLGRWRFNSLAIKVSCTPRSRTYENTISSQLYRNHRHVQNKDIKQKGILDPLVIIYTPVTYGIKTKYTDFHIYIYMDQHSAQFQVMLQLSVQF